jgi:hypothetical protein
VYDGSVAKNLENLWQYSKVYKEHADENGNPTETYFKWAAEGWAKDWADRYPMGKGRAPLYSWWDDQKLPYIEARKKIYAPLYAKAVENTEAYKMLKEIHEQRENIWLWDFDGYDHHKLGMSYEDVLNNPARKMGHAFVLAMMLEGQRVWEN